MKTKFTYYEDNHTVSMLKINFLSLESPKKHSFVLGSTMLGFGARCRKNQGSYQPLMFTFSGAACSIHGLRIEQQTMFFMLSVVSTPPSDPPFS